MPFAVEKRLSLLTWHFAPVEDPQKHRIFFSQILLNHISLDAELDADSESQIEI